MEPFFSKFGGTATLPHPRQYHPRPDNRAYQRQTTWDSRFHTLPSRSSHSSRSAHQLYGDTGGDLHTHGGQRYDVAQGAMYGMAQPQHNWTTSYTREAPNPQGVVAGIYNVCACAPYVVGIYCTVSGFRTGYWGGGELTIPGLPPLCMKPCLYSGN